MLGHPNYEERHAEQEPSGASLRCSSGPELAVYACICAAVTDDQVRDAICRGCATVDEIGAATGAGTGCGTCQDHLCDMIRSFHESRSQRVAAAS